MAYGDTNPYDLQNIGFQQIMGAGQGGQDLQSLIQGLYGTLREGGYFGAGEKGSLADIGFGAYADPNTPQSMGGHIGWGGNYNYELGSADAGTGIMGRMQQNYGEGVLTDPSEHQKGMQSLLELLKSVNIPGMQKEYGQDIGDVRAEIGSQMQGLQKGLTMGGKSGRYSGIAAPRRNLSGGGRQQYMSDYYGLQEKQFEMERDMQKSMEEDLYSQVGQYMQLNPV
jgi:hypothetical protein|tara:strand:+ start:511 stop:1185 length:675 start_codon:yes stop_codon:yes gene_type:complete